MSVLITGLSLVAVTVLTSLSQNNSSADVGQVGTWQSVVRINAGGGAYTDTRGLQWAADNYAIGGAVHSVSNAIAGTTNPALFRSERWGMSGYDIPVTNGSYQLKLYFAEINPSSGRRVMTVSQGTNKLLGDFSISDAVGDFTAEVRTFDVTVANGHLPLSFSASSNSASIAAIELLKPNATSVYRLNAGGGSYVDTRGLRWSSDRHFTAAAGGVSSTTRAITGTDNAALYQDERWGMTDYDIPLANNTYILKLYFAEINPESGRRSFGVSAGSQTLLSNFNISDKVGNFAADVEQAVVKVTDGTLHLNFTAGQNSPSVAAIEVLLPIGQSTDSDELVSATSTTAAPTSTTVKPTTTTVKPTTTTALPTATTAKPASGVITPSMAGWTMVKSDDFNGTSLSSANWGVYNGTGNEGVGFRRPSQISVSNGEMQIRGEGNLGGGAAFNYSSVYGRYVIKARMDAGTGYGPAILLWPDSERWPQDGEIDITEMPEGARNYSHFTVHWGANNSQVGYSTKGDFTQWHTWTLDWTADHISCWIDGVLVTNITTSAAIPRGSMHLAVQNDVGAAGHWIPARTSSTPATVSLHIDSVQIYKRG